MDRLSDGLGFLIRLFALLMVWLIIILYVSPELGLVMALAVFGLWAIIFLPLGLLQHLTRPRLPLLPPLPSDNFSPPLNDPRASPQGGQMVIVDETGTPIQPLDDLPLHPDVELPPHPYFEPESSGPQGSLLKRSLVMPLAALLMLFGIWQTDWLSGQLTAAGLKSPEPIAWEKLESPADMKSLQQQAARLTLRREGFCHNILSGTTAPADQLSRQKKKADDQSPIVFEFICEHPNSDGKTYLVWVDPADIPHGLPWPSFTGFTTAARAPADVEARCAEALDLALKSKNVRPVTGGDEQMIPTEVFNTRAPSPGHARAFLSRKYEKADGSRIVTKASCWVTPAGKATVRLDGRR